jgi:O-antigen/teichoic acid export membrane protein
LSKSEYGSFRQVWLINKNLLEVFAFGIPLSIFYFLPRLDDKEKRNFIIQSLILLASSGSFFTIMAFLFANKIGVLFNNPDLAKYLRFFCIYPLFILPTLGLQSILISLGKTILFSIFTLVDKFILLVLVGISLIIFQKLEAILITIVIYAFFESIISIYLSLIFTKFSNFKIKIYKFQNQIKFAFPSGISNIVGILNQETDKIMIATYFSVKEFARYANGAFEIPFISTVASSVTSVLLPEFANKHERGDFESLIKLWHEAIRKVAIFFIPIIILLIIYSTEFITIIFSKKYSDSSIIFRIYLLAMLPKVTWYGPILVAMGYNKEQFIAASIALISNVTLNYVFINLIGFIGPAIATVFSTYIITFYYIYRIKMVTKIKLINTFPWGDIIKMIIISLIFGMLTVPVANYFNISNITRLGIGIIGFYIPVYLTFAKINLIQNSDINFIVNYLIRFKQTISKRN